MSVRFLADSQSIELDGIAFSTSTEKIRSRLISVHQATFALELHGKANHLDFSSAMSIQILEDIARCCTLEMKLASEKSERILMFHKTFLSRIKSWKADKIKTSSAETKETKECFSIGCKIGSNEYVLLQGDINSKPEHLFFRGMVLSGPSELKGRPFGPSKFSFLEVEAVLRERGVENLCGPNLWLNSENTHAIIRFCAPALVLHGDEEALGLSFVAAAVGQPIHTQHDVSNFSEIFASSLFAAAIESPPITTIQDFTQRYVTSLLRRSLNGITVSEKTEGVASVEAYNTHTQQVLVNRFAENYIKGLLQSVTEEQCAKLDSIEIQKNSLLPEMHVFAKQFIEGLLNHATVSPLTSDESILKYDRPITVHNFTESFIADTLRSVAGVTIRSPREPTPRKEEKENAGNPSLIMHAFSEQYIANLLQVVSAAAAPEAEATRLATFSKCYVADILGTLDEGGQSAAPPEKYKIKQASIGCKLKSGERVLLRGVVNPKLVDLVKKAKVMPLSAEGGSGAYVDGNGVVKRFILSAPSCGSSVMLSLDGFVLSSPDGELAGCCLSPFNVSFEDCMRHCGQIATIWSHSDASIKDVNSSIKVLARNLHLARNSLGGLEIKF